MKGYTEHEAARILGENLEIPELVNEKMREAYRKIGAASGDETGTKRPASGRRTYRSRRRIWVAAAAAAAITAASAGVLAANGFFAKRVIEEDASLSYTFDMNYEMTPHEVTVTPGYIPEGYTAYETGKYDKDGLHKGGISICTMNAAVLATQRKFLNVENLESIEKTTLDGMEAHVLQLKWDYDRTQYGFDKRIYLFNPEEGYIVELFGGVDLSMEELKKVADQLQIAVDESSSIDYQEAELKYGGAQETEIWTEPAYLQEQVAALGDTVHSFSGACTTVKSVRVADSLSDYAKENYYDYENTIAAWLNEDGTWKPYERLTVDCSTGEEIARETMNQKIIEVTCEAENPTDEVLDYWAASGRLESIRFDENGTEIPPATATSNYDLDQPSLQIDGAPVWFDQSQHTGEDRNHFYFCDLQPGESLEYRLLYVADADVLDHIYLVFETGATGDGRYALVDVSQR